MKSMLHKIFELGIKPVYGDKLKRKIRICNQIALVLFISVFLISFFFFYNQIWILFIISLSSALLYALVLVLNFFYLQQYARFSLSFLPSLITFVAHISFIQNEETIDTMLIGNLIITLIPWLLFDIKEKLYLYLSFLTSVSFIFLLKPISAIFPIHFEASIFQVPFIEYPMLFFVIFIFGSLIYVLKYDTFIAENKNEVFIQELKDQQQEINSQNEELLQQQEELNMVNESLKNTLEQLQTTTSRLSKSINYAQNIQRIILPNDEDLGTFFQDFFTIYLPKDIVSGDFYWFQSLNDKQAIFIMADCTGHGVPGAFMSMIANTLLHEIVNAKKVISPPQILHLLHNGIRYLLKQEETRNTDGMDLSVCLFTQEGNAMNIDFAGAKSFILYVKDGTLNQLNSDRISVGGLGDRMRNFTSQYITLNKGDLIYFLSDGFIDQNNSERKRFGSKNFQQLIKDIVALPLSSQKAHLMNVLLNHQQEEEQRDDISVVGFRI
jgi:serine phosphatase RsbU (regulator of sigma subunit)